MRLDFSHNLKLPLSLPAAEYLKAIKHIEIPAAHKGVRHPLGLYNISLKDVISSAKILTEEISACGPFDDPVACEKFLASKLISSTTKLFILSMEQHLDACEKVITSYAKDEKQAKRMVREFKTSLGRYGTHILVQANHIKHRHDAIRNLCLTTHFCAVPGYFLEGGLDAETAGPDPIIHDGGNTAFSYFRELRLFCSGIVFISRRLNSILQINLGKMEINDEKEVDGLAELVAKIASFPLFMFPDEYKKEYAQASVKNGILFVSFGSKKPPPNTYLIVNFKTSLSMDGITTTYRVPYLGRK
jgi:hypothetical protein